MANKKITEIAEVSNITSNDFVYVNSANSFKQIATDNFFAANNKIASENVIGGVKIGEGLRINEEGLLSVKYAGASIGRGEELPVGSIVEYSGAIPPKNWLILDGSAVSRIEYADLFDLYGTKYGAGDGSLTFNLPDFRGRVPIGLDDSDEDFNVLGNTGGEKEHQLTVDEMPAHGNHLFTTFTSSGSATSKYLSSMSSYGSAGRGWNTYSSGEYYPDGQSLGNDQPHNNLQPYIVVNYIVKAKIEKADYTLTEEKNIKTLLWTNPNPAIEFTAQTINLDLSGYDSVCIEYRPFMNYVGTKSVTAPIGTTALGDLSMSNLGLVNGTNTYNGFRHMEVTENGINVQQGYNHSAADNRSVIPVRVYGVKDKINITTAVATDKGQYVDLLWENPNPTSEFAAQTINLDLSGYDMVEIYSYGRTGQSGYSYGYNSDRFLIGEFGNIQNSAFIGASIDYILVESRPLNVTKTGITFEKGSTLYTNSSTHVAGVTSNSSAVPYKIYGIKFNASTTSTIMGDYVVEEGAEGIWTYRKWNSGIVEFWGKQTYSNLAITSVYASKIYYTTISENLPFTIVEGISVQVSVYGEGIDFVGKTSIDTTSIGYYWCNHSSYTAKAPSATFYAMGRWK